MPKISVIIPTYNCARYIIDAIHSVLNQSYLGFEIIVVDDGSTDNTNDILKPFIEKTEIRYIYQENKGLPGARNKGIKIARGEFLAFLDADDELAPEALEKCISSLEESGADWCITDILRIENEKKEIRLSEIPKEDLVFGILNQDFIRRGFFIRKKCIVDLGLYDEAIINREDWDLNIRLIMAKGKFVYINEPLYIYKIRKNSITKNNSRRILFYTEKVIQKHQKQLADHGNKEVRKIYSGLMWNLAREYFYVLKDVKKVIYCLGESLRYDFNLSRFFSFFNTSLRRLFVRKTLLITNDFLPHKGGSRIYYYNIYKRFEKNKIVILTHTTSGYEEFDKRQSLKIYRTNLDYSKFKNEKVKELFRYFKLVTHSFYVVLKENVSVIHCGEMLPTGLIGLMFKLLFRIPYVVYVHGEELTIMPKVAKNEYKLAKLVLKKADKVIAACTFAESKIRDMGVNETRILKVLPGLDDDFLLRARNSTYKAEEFREKFGLNGHKVILTVGRLIERKGHDSVIRSLPLILKAIPEVQYLVIGKGPEYGRLNTLAHSLNVQDHVQLIGEVSEDDIVSYYKTCDLFIMPNKVLDNGDTEGFGIVFLEASALGKPVIGGKSGGTEDSILDGVTGYRVNSDNIEEIADKVTYLLGNPELMKKMGEAGRQRAVELFDMKRNVKQIEEVCKL